MDNQIASKMNRIRLLANSDDEYYHMIKELRVLEARYHHILGTLSAGGQNVICDFISKCEEISLKMLEIACRHMDFVEYQE